MEWWSLHTVTVHRQTILGCPIDPNFLYSAAKTYQSCDVMREVTVSCTVVMESNPLAFKMYNIIYFTIHFIPFRAQNPRPESYSLTILCSLSYIAICTKR